MMRWGALLLSTPAAHAHGSLTIPLARSGGNTNDPDDWDPIGNYYTGHTTIPGKALKRADNLITENRYDDTSSPWRNPGTAPVEGGGCGRHCPGGDCNGNYGTDARDLAPKEKAVWTAGAAEEVAFGINTNHGGGYSYRLCPASGEVTEECFQNNALDFVGNTTWVQHLSDKSSRKAIPATRWRPHGTTMWTKNPVPDCCEDENCKKVAGFDDPDEYPGLHFRDDSCSPEKKLRVNIVDLVRVPASLKPGHYLLSWRWDVEETHEVWENCGDVTIKAGGPTPPAPPAPAGTRYHCDSGVCVKGSTGHSTEAKCKETCSPAPAPPSIPAGCKPCVGDSTDDNCYHASWSGSGVNKCEHKSSKDACEDDGGQWCIP